MTRGHPAVKQLPKVSRDKKASCSYSLTNSGGAPLPVIIKAVRKSQIHDHREYCDFCPYGMIFGGHRASSAI